MDSFFLSLSRYLQRPLLRTKRRLVRTDAVPRTSEDHNLFKTIRIHAPRHIIINIDGEEEKRNSNGQGSLGHWVTDICYIASNFQPELSSRGVQSVSSCMLHACCIVGTTRDFLDLKISTKLIAISLLMTTRTCGRRAGLTDCVANLDQGLSALSFICSSSILTLVCKSAAGCTSKIAAKSVGLCTQADTVPSILQRNTQKQ